MTTCHEERAMWNVPQYNRYKRMKLGHDWRSHFIKLQKSVADSESCVDMLLFHLHNLANQSTCEELRAFLFGPVR